MYLRDLRVYPGHLVKQSDCNVPFRFTTHHVTNIFMCFLPAKYELDGSSVLQITCGLDDEKIKYRKIMNSSEYRIPDFDFKSYYQLSKGEQENLILEIIQTVLLDIAHLCGTDESVIRNTTQAVKNQSFYHKILIKKLRACLRSTKCRV